MNLLTRSTAAARTALELLVAQAPKKTHEKSSCAQQIPVPHIHRPNRHMGLCPLHYLSTAHLYDGGVVPCPVAAAPWMVLWWQENDGDTKPRFPSLQRTLSTDYSLCYNSTVRCFVGQTLLSPPLPATAQLLQRPQSLGNRAGQDRGQIKL